jgi:hypothetical protein
MPPPLDLTDKHYGKLTVLGLLKDRDKHGRRLWRCRCKCGQTVAVSRLLLQSGHKKTCGRLCPLRPRRQGRPFIRTAAQRAHDEKEQIVDGTDVWLAPRAAAKCIRRSYPTLVKWRQICPFTGQGITTRPMRSAYNREITYYLKADLDRIAKAIAARTRTPEYPGLIHVEAAAEELGVSPRTLRRCQKAYGSEAKTRNRPGKSEDGRALPRRYTMREFLDVMKDTRQRASIPDDKVSVKEAARILQATPADVHNLIAAGLLAAEDGQGVTVAEAREGGSVLRYPRKCKLVPRAAVEHLQTAVAAQQATTAESPRPGRPRGLLRRAAESLREQPDSTPNRESSTRNAPTMPGAESRGGTLSDLAPYPVRVVNFEDLVRVQQKATARVVGLRLLLDPLTQTVTLDGESIRVEDPRAFLVYQAIAAAGGAIVTTDELNKLPSCKGRIDRILRDYLPEKLRQTYGSKVGNGGGYWLRLPTGP